MTKCVLSGLDIPSGKSTREHVAPKSKVPRFIAQQPYNIRPAIKIINNIKGNLFLCQWEDMKLDLCYHALYSYKLRPCDKHILRDAIEKFENEPRPEACEICICAQKKYQSYCYDKQRLNEYRGKER